jgi:hypothetical protein
MSVRSTIAWGGIIAGAILPGIQWVCLAATEEASPASAVAAPFNDDSNPYSVITGRNVFHLNPLPPPAVPDKGPPPVLPKVYLSGFMWTGDKLEVLLVVKTQNPDPRAAEVSSYLTLGEGAKEGVVELVKVYAGQEKVDIINSGTPMTISMKDNGVIGDAQPPVTVGRPTPPMRRKPKLLIRSNSKLLIRDDAGVPIREPQRTDSPPRAASAVAPPVDGDNSQGNGVVVVGGATLQ